MPDGSASPPPATRSFRQTIGGNAIALWDRSGDALPFVFIHGNSASKEAFRALFEGDELKGHRLIALDLPGCGESDDAADPAVTYNLPGLNDVVVGAIDALRLSRYVLVGWSLGGHLAIEMLMRGAKPTGMVLSGTPPCGPDPAEIAATFLPAEGAEVMSMETPSEAQMAAFLHSVYAPSSPYAALVQAAHRADGRLRRMFFEYVFANPGIEPQRVTVAQWLRPIALVQGRGEPFFAPEKLDEQSWGNLWLGRTQWIDDAGHAPFITRPQAYGRVLKAFADDLTAAI